MQQHHLVVDPWVDPLVLLGAAAVLIPWTPGTADTPDPHLSPTLTAIPAGAEGAGSLGSNLIPGGGGQSWEGSGSQTS